MCGQRNMLLTEGTIRGQLWHQMRYCVIHENALVNHISHGVLWKRTPLELLIGITFLKLAHNIFQIAKLIFTTASFNGKHDYYHRIVTIRWPVFVFVVLLITVSTHLTLCRYVTFILITDGPVSGSIIITFITMITFSPNVTNLHLINSWNIIRATLRTLIDLYMHYITQVMNKFRALLCLVWLGNGRFYSYNLGLLHCHWDNHMIAPVPVKLPWIIWTIKSPQFIKNW